MAQNNLPKSRFWSGLESALKSSGKSSPAVSEMTLTVDARNATLAANRVNGFRFHLDRVRAGFLAQFFLFGGGGGDAVGAEKLCRFHTGSNQFLADDVRFGVC